MNDTRAARRDWHNLSRGVLRGLFFSLLALAVLLVAVHYHVVKG